jgi:hypothetical protein
MIGKVKKKEICFLCDVRKAGTVITKDERFFVEILKIDVCGYIERYPADNTMESYFGYCALCEFESGKIMAFMVDTEIHIVGDVE